MRVLVLVLFMVMSASVQAEIDPKPAIYNNAEQFLLRSEQIDQEYLIQVGLPASYGLTDKTYSVAYVLDGNIFFGLATDSIRLLQFDLIEPGFPELIVVSIGYPKPEDLYIRSRDLTPENSVPESFWEVMPPGMVIEQGGAANFLKFIESTLDPIIRKQYRTDGNKATILGDSFGGLFTYYAFLQQSPLFDKYWLGSVGLIQEDSRWLDGLPKLLAETDFKGQRVYMSLGEGEFSHAFYEVMARNFSIMTAHFNKIPAKNLHYKTQVFPGQTHASVVPASLTEALRYLYGSKKREANY